MEQDRSNFVSDPIPQHLHKAIEKAEHLGDERLWARAYDILLGVNAELKELGIQSGFVAWLLAVAADTIGKLEEAIAYIAQARALDLAFNRVITSEKIIIGHVLTLLDVAGPDDLEVLSVVEALRRHFPANHPGLRLVEEKLAQTASDRDSTRERAVA
jgi:hypothetical protein